MRRLSAQYIYTGKGTPPLKKGIVELSDNGKIINIIDTAGKLEESKSLEFYNGILVPGFINTHCHLELSHIQGKLPVAKGLEAFIGNISQLRKADFKIIEKAIADADKTMQQEGIVAVGDISNTNHSFSLKAQSPIRYYTFVEVFTRDKYKANEYFEHAKRLAKELTEKKLSHSIVPHATYSVHPKLFELITQLAYETNGIMTMHNQEASSENQLFREAKGRLFDTLQNAGMDFWDFYPTGFNSLPSTLHNMAKCNKNILVHNIYTDESDIDWANRFSDYIYWAVCPQSNYNLENRMANLTLFKQKKQRITIGTDSLASSPTLSVLEQMKLILEKQPQITFYDTIQWATYNGAEALDMHHEIGSIEIGKTPGINLIEHFDFEKMTLKPNSKVRKLV